MITRKIEKSEFKRADELFYLSFGFGCEKDKTNEEMLREIEENPDTPENRCALEKWASFTDEGDMMSVISLNPYNVNFDGNSCKMSGIGGVSTLPHYRRGGSIRRCFEELLADLYKTGYAFSYLYPFSTGYYSKFGYEICGEKESFTIDLNSLKQFETKATIHLYEAEKNNVALSEIQAVYDKFTKGYNMCVLREADRYSFFTANAPVKDKTYINICKDENGIVTGIMSWNKAESNGVSTIACSNLWYCNGEALRTLLSFAKTFRDYYKNISFTLPKGANLLPYIDEWALYPYTHNVYYSGMARVVNVKNVLELAAYKGSGRVVISVSDKQISENNNTYAVLFEDDKAVSVTACDCAADVKMEIGRFSQMILGFTYWDNICDLSGVQIIGNVENLKKVFYSKPVYITNGF